MSKASIRDLVASGSGATASTFDDMSKASIRDLVASGARMASTMLWAAAGQGDGSFERVHDVTLNLRIAHAQCSRVKSRAAALECSCRLSCCSCSLELQRPTNPHNQAASN